MRDAKADLEICQKATPGPWSEAETGIGMREIKFRGRRKADGKWVFGAYIPFGHYIKEQGKRQPYSAVDPATVGQDTGLRDRNGQSIYDGDILGDIWSGVIWWCNRCKQYQLHMIFSANRFECLGCDGDVSWNELVRVAEGSTKSTILVVGNIYDNPELLEE